MERSGDGSHETVKDENSDSELQLPLSQDQGLDLEGMQSNQQLQDREQLTESELSELDVIDETEKVMQQEKIVQKQESPPNTELKRIETSPQDCIGGAGKHFESKTNANVTLEQKNERSGDYVSAQDSIQTDEACGGNEKCERPEATLLERTESAEKSLPVEQDLMQSRKKETNDALFRESGGIPVSERVEPNSVANISTQRTEETLEKSSNASAERLVQTEQRANEVANQESDVLDDNQQLKPNNVDTVLQQKIKFPAEDSVLNLNSEISKVLLRMLEDVKKQNVVSQLISNLLDGLAHIRTETARREDESLIQYREQILMQIITNFFNGQNQLKGQQLEISPPENKCDSDNSKELDPPQIKIADLEESEGERISCNPELGENVPENRPESDECMFVGSQDPKLSAPPCAESEVYDNPSSPQMPTNSRYSPESEDRMSINNGYHTISIHSQNSEENTSLSEPEYQIFVRSENMEQEEVPPPIPSRPPPTRAPVLQYRRLASVTDDDSPLIPFEEVCLTSQVETNQLPVREEGALGTLLPFQLRGSYEYAQRLRERHIPPNLQANIQECKTKCKGLIVSLLIGVCIFVSLYFLIDFLENKYSTGESNFTTASTDLHSIMTTPVTALESDYRDHDVMSSFPGTMACITNSVTSFNNLTSDANLTTPIINVDFIITTPASEDTDVTSAFHFDAAVSTPALHLNASPFLS